jgi:hypothetical protein
MVAVSFKEWGVIGTLLLLLELLACIFHFKMFELSTLLLLRLL